MKPLTVALTSLAVALVLTMTAVAVPLTPQVDTSLVQDSILAQTSVPPLLAQDTPDDGGGLTLAVIIQLVLAVLVVADIVVRLTPTKKDDEFVRKIKALLKHVNIDPDNPPKK